MGGLNRAPFLHTFNFNYCAHAAESCVQVVALRTMAALCGCAKMCGGVVFSVPVCGLVLSLVLFKCVRALFQLV